jgi:hypothetical protein
VYKQRGGDSSDDLKEELVAHLDFLDNFLKAEEDQPIKENSAGASAGASASASAGASSASVSMSNKFNATIIGELVRSKFNYLNDEESLAEHGRSLERNGVNASNRPRPRSGSENESPGMREDEENSRLNIYEYNMDFLEFYEAILGEKHISISKLLNRYRIMNYINKNSFSDIEESIKKIRVGDMPDPMRNAEFTNDSIIKILIKEVTTEAIDKVMKNIVKIREMCKRDMTDDEYIDITGKIDVHLGEAHEFLKVAEVAYEAEKEYLSSRYEPAIQYLQEVLTLYPVVVVTAAAGASTVAATSDENMLTSGNGAGGASPQSEASNRRGINLLSQPARAASQSQATQSQASLIDSTVESPPFVSAPPSEFGSPFGSPRGARQAKPPMTARDLKSAFAAVSPEIPATASVSATSDLDKSSVSASASVTSDLDKSSVENDRSATKIFLDGLNLSLMGKLKYTMDAIRDTKDKLVSNVPMGGNSRPTPAGGASARRLTFNTGSNRRNQTPRRKTQRKPRR